MRKHQHVILYSAIASFLLAMAGAYFINDISTDIEQIGIVNETREYKYKSVKVFFSNNKNDPSTLYCDKTYVVEREADIEDMDPRSMPGELAYFALSELLKGPQKYEKEVGFFTSINDEVDLLKISIENGIATVDFSEELNEGVAGSCRVMAIRSQISETLKQFSEVKDVIISVEGRTEDILQP